MQTRRKCIHRLTVCQGRVGANSRRHHGNLSTRDSCRRRPRRRSSRSRARALAQEGTLKISHQFPGGTLDRGRLPRPAVPPLRGRHREAQQRRAEGRGLSGLVADEDERAVLGDAQGRARPEPVPAVLRRRRGARDQHRPDARAGAELRVGRGWKTAEVGKLLAEDARRQGHHHRQLDLAGAAASPAARAARGAGRRQGHEGARRQPRDGHDAQGGGRVGHLAAVQRDLRRDADRRDGRGDDLVDQPDLVQARGDRQAPDHRRATRPTGSCSSR